jgi:hypothetical protein
MNGAVPLIPLYGFMAGTGRTLPCSINGELLEKHNIFYSFVDPLFLGKFVTVISDTGLCVGSAVKDICHRHSSDTDKNLKFTLEQGVSVQGGSRSIDLLFL